MTFKLRYENYSGDTKLPKPVTIEWPSDLMPGVPEYGNKGIIVEVNTLSSGYVNKNIQIIIGQATSDAYSDYCDRVLQSGWVLNSTWTIADLKSGKWCSLKKDGYDFTLELGLQNDGNYFVFKRW